jgi:hypothetical protein
MREMGVPYLGYEGSSSCFPVSPLNLRVELGGKTLRYCSSAIHAPIQPGRDPHSFYPYLFLRLSSLVSIDFMTYPVYGFSCLGPEYQSTGYIPMSIYELHTSYHSGVNNDT